MKLKPLEQLGAFYFERRVTMSLDNFESNVNKLVDVLLRASEELHDLKEEIKTLSSNNSKINYDGKFYNERQYEQIIQGLDKGLDVSVYLDPELHELKMACIKTALLDGVCISKETINSFYDLPQLFQVIRASRLDIIRECPLLSPSLPADKMSIYISSIEKGVDITPYIDEFDSRRLELIMECLINNYDVTKLAIAGLSYEQMEVVYNGLSNQLDVSQYNNASLSVSEMKDKYYTLLNGTDKNNITFYVLPPDANNKNDNVFSTVEEAFSFRVKSGGSLGVLYNTFDTESGILSYKSCMLLNSYGEVNRKDIEEAVDTDKELFDNERFVTAVSYLIERSTNYVPISFSTQFKERVEDITRTGGKSI